jgi:hypothetical protein
VARVGKHTIPQSPPSPEGGEWPHPFMVRAADA